MRHILTAAIVTFGVVATRTATNADDNPVTPEEVVKFVEQLDSDQFATRAKAVEWLTKAGTVAVPGLLQAAESDSIEKRFRALRILGDFYSSEDEATQTVAKKALEKLRDSKVRGTARVAKRLLDRPTYDLPPGIWRGTGRVNGFQGGLVIRGAKGVRISGGRINIGADSQIIVSKVANGMRTVDVFQGTGLGLYILDGANRKRIEVHVRRINNGGVVYKRYLAKNPVELAEKPPEISKLYKKYAKIQHTRTTIQGGVN